jgi:catechol 2,3-dioxygenase
LEPCGIPQALATSEKATRSAAAARFMCVSTYALAGNFQEMGTDSSQAGAVQGALGQGWPLGAVELKVLDLKGAADFYERFGLTRIEGDSRAAILGSGGTPLLRLRALDGGRARPRHTAGLYHFAILLPSEQELGGFLKRALEERLPLTGTADHYVSQALYFDDPEGNGIEVYADRTRNEWQYPNGHLKIGTDHLDFERLLGIAVAAHKEFSEGTVLGHMHLNVGDLDRSQAFYESLGMALMGEVGGVMRFMSWDGYHHHLGINLLAGRDAAPVEPDVAGVESFEVRRTQGGLTDPDGIQISPAA